jgi:type II secretory pathway predicted ATPase ExeA
MYLDFYGFREKPFNLTPDPRFVFLSKNHREALRHRKSHRIHRPDGRGRLGQNYSLALTLVSA